MKTGIFYGSTLGTTETLADQIAGKLSIQSSDIHNVSDVSADKMLEYDRLLLGSSTWGDGELQDDWISFVEDAKKLSLSGKEIALFGCGDSDGYADTFCEAIAIIHGELEATECKFIGHYEPTNYGVTDLAIARDGKFIGLAIDDTNESDLTEVRINTWIKNF